jgi:prepilin-type N-terminal cleavage/methylation domain-containing protein
MMFHWLRLFHKNQLGFTLVEVILAIAISGIITGGITMTIFQVITGNIRTGNHMTAVRQVQNAGYWVSHDTQMAQTVTPDPGDSGFPLDLVIPVDTNPDNDYSVSYFLDGDKLKRSKNGSPETLIAQYIAPDQTSCVWDGSVLTFNVTATVGEQTETRIYEVMPRPGS